MNPSFYLRFRDLVIYENIDPFTRISFTDKKEIISYLKSYHGYIETDIDIERFIALLPKVMKKIQDKVVEYNDQLSKRLTKKIE